MAEPTEQQLSDLKHHRSRLDNLDLIHGEVFADYCRARGAVSDDIAAVKLEAGMDAVQPGRRADVLRDRIRHLVDLGVDEILAGQFVEAVVSYSERRQGITLDPAPAFVPIAPRPPQGYDVT